MAGMESTRTLPSMAVFCPQSKAPQESYLDSLRAYLIANPRLKPLVEAIEDLETTWKIFADFREDIAALQQGPRYMKNLASWIQTGNSAPVANAMSGILALPLLTIIQIVQYFQYMDTLGVDHSTLVAALNRGGIQGYCGGLLPAVAIACSKDEDEVVHNVIKSVRLALGIGAFGELGDDENIPGPTTIVVRLKKVGQGDEIVKNFPGCYVSAITDPKTISIVGSVHNLEKVANHARSMGLIVSAMHLRGKVHNPENADLATELCQLADQHESLSLPHSSQLSIEIRSNINGNPIRNISITHETVHTILASKCEWWTLLQGVAAELEAKGEMNVLCSLFGIGDCMPLAPFHMKQVQVRKLDVLSFIRDNLSLGEADVPANNISPAAYPPNSVAIVGVGCRLPGAEDIEDLWEMMAKGESRHVEVPTSRLDIPGSFKSSLDQKWSAKQRYFGNFIENVEGFDHTFFKTSPREAVNMDPQQRVLLEAAYQAVDSSGYMRTHERQSADNVGCFVGASFVEYLDNTAVHAPTAYTSTGTIRAFLSGKISYYFGWHGPSEVIDTACSSSLVAINRAVKAIQSGECHSALAGGVNIITGIHNHLDLTKAGFLSSTGQCKPFDVKADGYARSEGVGLVFLRPLESAIADGQQVLGVIAGVATNQGGLSPSITVPSSPAQKTLYKEIVRQSGLQPSDISYVEAHGTGTQVGDPLEIASIREVFAGPQRKDPVTIGSLKGNIGHVETGAGVASLAKVLAMIQHRSLPPLANHKSLNPKIPSLEQDKMRIITTTQPWLNSFRAACINSYGAAGSNSALICCEGPQPQYLNGATAIAPSMAYPVIISANSRESLAAYSKKLRSFLKGRQNQISVADLAYTLDVRRARHKTRFVGEFSTIPALHDALETAEMSSIEAPAVQSSVCLAFSGQSRRIVGLDKALYNSSSRVKYHIDACDALMQSLGHPSILPAAFSPEPLEDVVVLQCGTFALQYAMAMCWIESGVKVAALVGHSFGELTALTVSGQLALEDGLKLIAARASLMQTKWGEEAGSMLAIHTTRDNVMAIIDASGSLAEIACYNSSGSQVVVGRAAEIGRVEEVIAKDPNFKGIRAQRLDVSHGFHSRFTDLLLDDLENVAKTLEFKEPRIPLESCTQSPLPTANAARIREHTRYPVYFEDAVRRIEDRLGACTWIEAGCGSPIIPMVKKALRDPAKHTLCAVDGTAKSFTRLTLDLWKAGLDTSFIQFLGPQSGYRQMWLPPYQFIRTAHWLPNIDRAIEALKSRPALPASPVEKPKGLEKLMMISRMESAKSEDLFHVNIGTRRFQTIVAGHAVRGRPLCPASVYMEWAVMASEIMGINLAKKTLSFKGLSFQSALGIDLSRNVVLEMKKSDEGSKAWNYEVTSTTATSKKGVMHGAGHMAVTNHSTGLQGFQRLAITRMKDIMSNPEAETLRSNRAYGLFAQVVSYAPLMRGISSITVVGNEALARIEVPAPEADTGESTVTQWFDAVALDTFIQVSGLMINSSDRVQPGEVYIASKIESATFAAPTDFHKNKSWTVYAMYTPLNDRQATGDVFVFGSDDKLAFTFMGCEFAKCPISTLEKLLDSANGKSSAGTGRGAVAKRPVVKTAASSATDSPSSLTESLSPAETPATSIDPREAAELTVAVSGAADAIRSVLSDYTGIGKDQIPLEAPVAELGIDSLAAVELAEELEGKLGKNIDTEELVSMSLKQLCAFFGVEKSEKKSHSSSKAAKKPKSVPVEAAPEPAEPSGDGGASVALLMESISDNCGAPASSIVDGATLQSLGLDSLSAVELKADLEEKFQTEIGDNDLSLESTVKEVMDYLGIKKSSPKTAKSAPAPAPAPAKPKAVPAEPEQPSADNGKAVAALLQSISDNCGAPTASIVDDATLQSLGLDSLSAVELKADLEEIFETEIGDNDLSLESTVKEVMEYLGIKRPSKAKSAQSDSRQSTTIKTVVYKEADGVEVPADIYLPSQPPASKMPIALMVHGGGNMTLSRKAIRPWQTKYLLQHGFLPVSADYRLCPEVTIVDGPMADVRDLLVWARRDLPGIALDAGVQVDTQRVVMVGWSSGGHLCMTTAWTAKDVGVAPPDAILGFYAPTDFEGGVLDARRAEEYPERSLSLDQIRAALRDKPLTSYDADGSTDRSGLGWVRPGDPRSELVLSLFKEGTGLPLMLNGLPPAGAGADENPLARQPAPAAVAAISPLAHVRDRSYAVPTFLIHGERDEIVPFATAQAFAAGLRDAGVEGGFVPVKGARHIHDLMLRPGQKEWDESVRPGYQFLFDVVSRKN